MFVLSSFLNNIAAALIGGSGSVVGNTSTTMMRIAAVSPLSVLEVYVTEVIALALFSVPASIQQEEVFSPTMKEAPKDLQIVWLRLGNRHHHGWRPTSTSKIKFPRCSTSRWCST